ncbi:uncharacterized protein LAJ45_09053 [Morchella importuna]|uniref:uncharacterized protein n=1 Tax=Morchella importuna TaxID=1174673 RepID=UPI001E8DFE77|nr:uncharacterized protein LAJ45_09053 [Morchella importuna]KAH8146972.1 hypothetical protein LAJ45_09053 [Morchella importuna]
MPESHVFVSVAASSNPSLLPPRSCYTTFILRLLSPREENNAYADCRPAPFAGVPLPSPLINFFYAKSRSLFNSLSPTRYTTVSHTKVEKDIVARVREADGFIELCEIWDQGNWRIEEHIVQTGDGYLLGLHRLVKKSTAEERNRNRGKEGNGGKKVVYLHHGLLMNSEVWVASLEKERCLPFVLAEKGFDVWCGNNRGNKYSKKSIHHPSTSTKFWNFSMDEFAFHDIPDSINYILETTKQKSLSYIGFSQGTAQAFATLSIHPALNKKVDVFIALAPAMSPAGLHNPIVDALMKTSPNIMFLFFGRKSILPSTTFWQSILYPPIFVRVIDFFLIFLFNWRGNNISLDQKIAAYSKLYSYASVKTVVHWFQIIRNRSFQMYDDDILSPIMAFSGKNFYKVAKFPTRNITTPIVLVYGGSDSLVDINVMLKELPGHTVAKEIEHYEHLDFLWARDVDKLVFPHVLEALELYSSGGEGKKLNGSASLRDEHTDTKDSALHFDSNPSRPSSSGSATMKIADHSMQHEMDGLYSSIKIPRGDKKRSGSVSSTFSTSSLGEAGMSPTSSRSLIGPGGITLGTGKPTAGVSTGLSIDESGE